MRSVLEHTPIPPKGIKPRRVPGSSGRLRKLPDGGWEFSDDEAEPQDKTEASSKRESADVNELKLMMEEMKGTEVKLSLRIRQSQSGQLQEISFPFVIGTGKGKFSKRYFFYEKRYYFLTRKRYASNRSPRNDAESNH